MDFTSLYFTLLMLFGGVSTRSFYAGRRPIGYPEVDPPTTTTSAAGLGIRVNNGETTTTERLPLEALGDRDLVRRIRKLPLDIQPFWYLNWKALEENRNNPQNYASKPNTFIDQSQQEFISSVMKNNPQNPSTKQQFQSDSLPNGQGRALANEIAQNSFLGSPNSDQRFNTNSFIKNNFNSLPSTNSNRQPIFPNTQYPNLLNPNNQQFVYQKRKPVNSWPWPNSGVSYDYPNDNFFD